MVSRWPTNSPLQTATYHTTIHSSFRQFQLASSKGRSQFKAFYLSYTDKTTIYRHSDSSFTPQLLVVVFVSIAVRARLLFSLDSTNISRLRRVCVLLGPVV